MTRIRFSIVPALLCAACILAGCGGTPKSGEAQGPVFRPVDTAAAVLWDRQTTETGGLLRQLAAGFNAVRPGLPVKVEFAGTYTDIFRKVSASIQAGVLPAMAVSYESMTVEYIPTGAVLDLDPLVNDPKVGLTRAELDDFFPAALQPNRYADFGGKMYSFPMAKSVLVLYYNRRVMEKAGITAPPATWDEFLDQCRKIKAATGKPAHAVSVDCSTVDAMIFSRGGDVVRGHETLFDSPQSLAVFELYATLAREGLAYQIPPSTFQDNEALGKDDIAFTFRTSSSRADLMLLMQNDKTRWGIARIPQQDPAHPATVLFGPNVTVFNTTEEQKAAAWDFLKWFTGPEASARWSVGTGYLPVRKSTLDRPETKQLFGEWECNRVPYDCLSFARSEPNIVGWQQVRDLVTRALSGVISGAREPDETAQSLKREADAALARAGRD
jgi:ABC-type glycerol-3-phosphate transport system substrate-binding protein